MTAFLVDEMFPMAAAVIFRDTYGYDALHVAEVGLRGADDTQIAAVARAEGRVLVTENVTDFAVERDVTLVFVLKRTCPRAADRPPHSPRSSTTGRRTTRTPTSVPTGQR